MYAPLKTKGSRKTKVKTKRTSVEERNYETQLISNCQVSDCLDSDIPNNDFDFTICDLAEGIEEISFHEKEDEEKDNLESDLHNLENNPQTSTSCEVDNKLESNENIQVKEIKLHDDSTCSGEETLTKNSLDFEKSESSITLNKDEREFLTTADAKTSDYYNLATKVKTLIKEENEASAPAVEICTESNKLRNILFSQDEKFENSEKSADIRKFSFTLNIEDVLSPFTDEKLKEYYFNFELYESVPYVNEFINDETNNGIRKENKFYKLLVEYVQSKNSLKANEDKIKCLKEKLNMCLSNMWTVWEDVEVTEKEKCSDGIIVSFSQNYTQAQFNTNFFTTFNSLLTEIKCSVFQTYITDLFKCSVLKLRIEYYLQCLLTSCPEISNLRMDSSISLSSPSFNSHFQQCLLNLKVAISVLFIFQRKLPLDIDRSFLEESRQWLSDLVAVLLRIGSWKDHIFLLSHIMRCPGGISEWATQFIQLPCSSNTSNPFNNSELNHMMTVMSVLLSPIEQRDNFIRKWESELESDVNPWTVIDSDGEVEDDDDPQLCPLKENDLVSLLNQIPFSYFFKSILKYDDQKFIDNVVNSDYVLQLLSFLTELNKIWFSGLKLYSTQRYKQFTKRLGRLIYHTVQYATDMLIIFKSQKIPEGEMARIQVEYDNFFLKSTKFIYSAKKHGAWQFLATIPYGIASPNTILKLYGILQLNDSQNECTVLVKFAKFEEKFLHLPEEEQFYLLTTLANMALARNITEIHFIKNVLLQLFYIGFLSTSTQDLCYKNVRSLLCSICSSYPFLMSEILHTQKNMFVCDQTLSQKLCSYLWKKLPVDKWLPDRVDLEILSEWLLEPISSVPNELAKIILDLLNYGMNQGKLFMPLEHHHTIAMMVLQSNVKLVFENETGVIKNMSNLVCFQTPKQGMNDWSWNLLFKLRLHLCDQPEASLWQSFSTLGESLRNIPDVEHNSDLHHLILKKHPLACYVALMTTTLGHSVPLIFDKGFGLVDVLLTSGKYEAGIACLEYMTLMFVECSESLEKCEQFMSLLSRLISADSSYVQLPKKLITSNFPGPVLKCLEVMLQNQLNCCKSVNFVKFSNVIRLWFLPLTKLPQWTQDPGVLYLVDKLLENSFFDGTSVKVVAAILEDLLESSTSASESKSSFSSLVSWMNSKYNPPSLLVNGFNGSVPWFSYHIIQMEFEIYENKCALWCELLKEMFATSDKKTNVDNSLKKVCNLLQFPVRPSSVLAIYKWTYQILETDFFHPLLPLIWQRFFTLYLYKVPGPVDHGSVGIKFFDGVVNQALFKRLKQRLQETCDYFKDLCLRSKDGATHEHLLKCSKLYQTYSLWLDDVRLQEPCVNVRMLSIQYNPYLLELLINGCGSPWIEYIEYRDIEQNFRNSSLKWANTKNRSGEKSETSTASQRIEKSLINRLKDRLNSYEIPMPPPSVKWNNYSFPRITITTLTHSDKMILYVKPYLNMLLEYTHQYAVELNENVSLGCYAQEVIPKLYFSTKTQKVLKGHCNGLNKTVNGRSVYCACSGPAVVTLNYEEFKINEQMKQNYSQCKKAFDENIKNAMDAFPPNLSNSMVLIDIAIEELKKEYQTAINRSNVTPMVNDLRGAGVHLFYEFVRTWCENVKHTPPVERAFDQYIDELGKTFIRGNAEENDRILHLILNDETFGEKLCDYFTPNASSTLDFIENYRKALECNFERRFTILSKFDLILWLSDNKPKFSERSRLLSVIGSGLKSLTNATQEDKMLKLVNHHLEILLMYDFPEHYGEVLNLLLEGSENQSIPTSCWFAFLNSLALGYLTFEEGRTDQNVFEPGQSVKKLKHCFSKYATEQNLISFEVIKGTITLLANTYKTERLKIRSGGLYQKYSLYVEPLFIFFGMLSYSCIAKAIELDAGSLSDKIAQKLWPLLSDLYSPWLIPYWTESDKTQAARWIQEQDFDRCVQLPWITNSSCYASFCTSVFTDSVRFLFDTLPGVNHILSYVWFFYVTHFAHIYVKDYVLNIIHENLLLLPWESFFPSLQDVELMLRVVDQFLPSSHSFLGSIFVNVKWTELVQHYVGLCDVETTAKLHMCLLHLLVKLPLEPSLKQNEKVTNLLKEAEGYAWHLVDSHCYEDVLNWFLMSCDPRIVLNDERLEYYRLDSIILRLLQACAGYIPSTKLFHPTTPTKRLMFIRACIKCLITSNRRFKSKDSPLFKSALCSMWNDMEIIINETVPQPQWTNEAGVLFAEFLALLSESELTALTETTLSDWFSNQKSQIVVLGVFRSAGIGVENPKIFGSIVEAALENYFNFTESCEWSEVISGLVSFKSNARLEKVLIDNNYILTLYAISVKKFHGKEGSLSVKLVLTDLLQLLSEVKPSAPLEPKLILLVILCFTLTEMELKCNVKEGISYLTKFFDTLNNFVSDKGNGFLSAIGLKKSFSNKFRLICLIACSGIAVFLKKNHPAYQDKVDEKVLQTLDSAENHKFYQGIHQYATFAKTAVKEMSSTEQIINFLKHIGLRLFNKLYLK